MYTCHVTGREEGQYIYIERERGRKEGERLLLYSTIINIMFIHVSLLAVCSVNYRLTHIFSQITICGRVYMGDQLIGSYL